MTKQQHTTQQIAATCAERRAEAQALLARIANCLAVQPVEATWAHAGDLNRVTEQLARVLADLGDRSAVDAKGLAY